MRADPIPDRVDPFTLDTNAIKALVLFDASTFGCCVEASLLTLVKLKVSMIFGSAFCVDRFMRQAIANGECIERLEKARHWRATRSFSKRERAALEWTEMVCRAADTHVPDSAYAKARLAFMPEELVALTGAIAAATAWNQMGVSFRLPRPPRRLGG